MTKNEIKAAAQKLGAEAFVSGAMCVPGWDARLAAIGFSVLSMKAWMKGWNAGCIEGMMAESN